MTHDSLLQHSREADLKSRQKGQKQCLLNQQFTLLFVITVCSRDIFHLFAML